ncbi:MAG: hypothetical protein EOR30_33630 [Mesorhizobium sp.]|uniref:hypothetical protein n=1 Tax=Mesorhizobium sp. TaxID=1871066 RepID=UPI000FE9DE92|nr:hypothetical protein [Mesorhizobium sp.]RWI62444.1 MAG: hypothetical protein EOR17_33180 [Mesorhizobium sp.]RWJ40844.1 MAG: hypothetical protein EOR30_33630 [Mesorhizobium sp.]RWJ58161.1 MAG: hypothetical protein EOR32_26635 [Mesorhizobium sp.]RWJ66643.1 MAG: hypothetical protein EOR34_27555 [Mesorhizobium sp.]RWJ93887.1 MAG: hypothetical protein EOR38_30300 [Mesorhizobium sp.]
MTAIVALGDSMIFGFWIAGLAVACIVWASLIETAMNGAPTSFQEWVGVTLGMGGSVFVGTGFVASLVYAVTKNRNKTLWIWTVLLLVAFAFLGIGAARMVRG